MARAGPASTSYLSLLDHDFLGHRVATAAQKAPPATPQSPSSTQGRGAFGQPQDSRPVSAAPGYVARSTYQTAYRPPTATNTHGSRTAAAAPAAAAATAAATQPQPAHVLQQQQQQQQSQQQRWHQAQLQQQAWGSGYQGKMTAKLASILKTHANSGKAETGRAVWPYLHQAAAQMPDSPSMDQQQDARQMAQLLVTSYPCPECAAHFREVIRREPPVVTSGLEFQRWMCRAHNAINRSMGKPEVDCNLITRGVPAEAPGAAAAGESSAHRGWAAGNAGPALGNTRGVGSLLPAGSGNAALDASRGRVPSWALAAGAGQREASGRLGTGNTWGEASGRAGGGGGGSASSGGELLQATAEQMGLAGPPGHVTSRGGEQEARGQLLAVEGSGAGAGGYGRELQVPGPALPKQQVPFPNMAASYGRISYMDYGYTQRTGRRKAGCSRCNR